MKTITVSMSMEDYNEELKKAKEEGRKEGYRQGYQNVISCASGILAQGYLILRKPEVKMMYTRIQIVHDYIFDNGRKACNEVGSELHYVVAQTEFYEYGPSSDYPCKEVVKFRCQDGTLHSFDTGVGFCFIQESQLQESL